MVAEGLYVATATPSLRVELEARRLEQRTRRLEFVIGALRDRAGSYERRGNVPRPLNEAITGYSVDLRSDRKRLEEMRRSAT